MENNTQLPIEVVDKIEQEAHDATCALYSPNNYDEFTSFRSGWEKGATAYASKLHQVEQENAELRRWKMEAAELLTKIHSYAHKHLEIKLGESIVDFVIARAKERDEFKRQNDKMKQQAEG